LKFITDPPIFFTTLISAEATDILQSDFDSIIKEHSGLLARVAATYEANPALQQELLQEISLAVWQGLRRFEGKSSVKTYILRIAHNRSVTHVSSQVKIPNFTEYNSVTDIDLPSSEFEPNLSQKSSNPESELASQQTVSALVDAVRQLPIGARQIVTLSLEGLSYQDIADICGTTTSNVGVILNRAKKQIMDIMNEAD